MLARVSSCSCEAVTCAEEQQRAGGGKSCTAAVIDDEASSLNVFPCPNLLSLVLR